MSTSNAEFAKSLAMPPEWQAKAAAFADAKGLSLAAREVVATFKEAWTGRDGKQRPANMMLVVTAEALMAQGLKARVFAPVATEFTDDGREWTDVWIAPGPPAACRVTFEVEGIDRPVVVVHTWMEYTQGSATATQMRMPATMLAKATRSLGVRQIAPSTTSGLVSEEEAHAVSSAGEADREHSDAVGDAVTPPSEADAKGGKLSRAEQYAARKEELISTGKALRADCGDEAAGKLAAIIDNMRKNGSPSLDLDKITAAQLKSILAAAKEIRAEAEAATREPEAPHVDPDEGTQAVIDNLNAEFVI